MGSLWDKLSVSCGLLDFEWPLKTLGLCKVSPSRVSPPWIRSVKAILPPFLVVEVSFPSQKFCWKGADLANRETGQGRVFETPASDEIGLFLLHKFYLRRKAFSILNRVTFLPSPSFCSFCHFLPDLSIFSLSSLKAVPKKVVFIIRILSGKSISCNL